MGTTLVFSGGRYCCYVFCFDGCTKHNKTPLAFLSFGFFCLFVQLKAVSSIPPTNTTSILLVFVPNKLTSDSTRKHLDLPKHHDYWTVTLNLRFFVFFYVYFAQFWHNSSKVSLKWPWSKRLVTEGKKKKKQRGNRVHWGLIRLHLVLYLWAPTGASPQSENRRIGGEPYEGTKYKVKKINGKKNPWVTPTLCVPPCQQLNFV